MIGVRLARQLKESGLRWSPAPGDRFVVPDRDLDDAVFVISDMTVAVHELPDGQVIGFNGTTEWALDDVELDEAVWLPGEDQLRHLLGGTFRALHRTDDGYRVETLLLGTARSFTAPQAAEAYGLALRQLIETSSPGR